ncbi:MAG: RluA family pseudouridine synthase [Candidatus Faecousia sp.]|nr:RluA family pseudouridine synthase [Candidatus Faecousia sp.]
MDILYQTKDVVVCIKPVGVDSEKGMPGLLAEALGGSFYPVHRLDQGVGGLMVFARSPKAAAELSALIAQGQLSKEYLALVHGCPEDTEGRMEDLLWKDSRKNKVYVVSRQRAGVKKAALRYRVLRKGEKSLVWVYLETGRSHQIRVQFASRGFPLVGDHKYGSRARENNIHLFSAGLTFPWKGEILHFEAKPEWAE